MTSCWADDEEADADRRPPSDPSNAGTSHGTASLESHILVEDEDHNDVAEVCHGAEHAHQHALLHRDIKPGNVLVAEVDGRARPKLIDFGIVKMLDASQMMSLTGPFLIGTPAYMSPEALSQDRSLDPRSDVYSLGVVLYELLTGTLPHPNVGGSIVAVHLQRMQQGPPEAPGARLAGLSAAELETTVRRRGTTIGALLARLAGGLDRVALRAIAEIPDQRFGSAAELAAAVEAFVGR